MTAKTTIKSKIVLALVLLTGVARAKDHKAYQSGTLLGMNSVQCGYDEKDGKSLAGEIVGTDSGHKKTQQLLCPEYVVETDRVIYRIRPKDQKHPVLLPVGEKAQFRLDRDKMVLRVEDLDNKERDYFVISMTPRSSPGEDRSSEKSRRD